MFGINVLLFLIGFFTLGMTWFLWLFTWIGGIAWAYMAADTHNKKLLPAPPSLPSVTTLTQGRVGPVPSHPRPDYRRSGGSVAISSPGSAPRERSCSRSPPRLRAHSQRSHRRPPARRPQPHRHPPSRFPPRPPSYLPVTSPRFRNSSTTTIAAHRLPGARGPGRARRQRRLPPGVRFAQTRRRAGTGRGRPPPPSR